MPASQWTDEQVLQAVNDEGSQRKAAEFLGVGKRALERRLNRIKAKGEIPYHMDHPLVTGVSRYEKTDNGAQWVKYNKTQQSKELALEAVRQAIKEDIRPLKPVKPPKPPKQQPEQLLNLFALTDFHLGMYAWDEEAGDNWDLAIAEELIVKWFAYAIHNSPSAATAVLAIIGDFLHWDGIEAITPSHGHLLDADTRFPKLTRCAIRIKRRLMQMLLKKHNFVHVIILPGNHDPASSAWMREITADQYRDEPRVTVDTNPGLYACYEFHDVSLFFHHGHKKDVKNVDTTFVGKFREVYGRTRHSYGHTGHKHHEVVHEGNLMIVTQHPTMSAADAHTSGLGHTTGRSAKRLTYHRKFGKVGEDVTTPEMVM